MVRLRRRTAPVSYKEKPIVLTSEEEDPEHRSEDAQEEKPKSVRRRPMSDSESMDEDQYQPASTEDAEDAFDEGAVGESEDNEGSAEEPEDDDDVLDFSVKPKKGPVRILSITGSFKSHFKNGQDDDEPSEVEEQEFEFSSVDAQGRKKSRQSRSKQATQESEVDTTDYTNHPARLELIKRLREAFESRLLLPLSEFGKGGTPAKSAKSTKGRGRPSKSGAKSKTDATTGEAASPSKKRKTKSAPAPEQATASEPTAASTTESQEPVPATEPASTETQEKQGYYFQIVKSSDNTRFACPIPGCDKDFKNKEGIMYHCKKFNHDIMWVLEWAFPVDNTTQDKENDKPEIQSDIMALMDQLGRGAFPIEFDDYLGIVPGMMKPAAYKVILDKFSSEPRQIRAFTSGSKRANASRRFEYSEAENSVRPNESMVKSSKPMIETTVYDDVQPTWDDWELLDEGRVAAYLPFSRSIHVSFADKVSQKSLTDDVELGLFDSSNIEIKKKVVTTANVGCSVWALDWCPVPETEAQYLAVSGYNDTKSEHHPLHVRQTTAMENMIQIWRVDTKTGASSLSLVICHEFGVCYDLKWLPFGGFVGDRLGLLAATFGDGKGRVLVVPRPEWTNMEEGKTIWMRCKSSKCTIDLGDRIANKLDWGGVSRLAFACSTGEIYIYDVQEILQETNPDPVIAIPHNEFAVRDLSFFQPHQAFRSQFSVVKSLTPDIISSALQPPTTLITCGMDGTILIYDLRDPSQPMSLQRARNFVGAVHAAPQWNGVFYTDTEGNVKYFWPADSDDNNPKGKSGKRPRGIVITHIASTHRSFVWNLNASPFVPHILSVSSDGTARIANFRRSFGRNYRSVTQTLYRLASEKANRYTFVENVDDMVTSDIQKSIDGLKYESFEPEVAIQRGVWNPNKKAAKWIATAGCAGILRIESAW